MSDLFGGPAEDRGFLHPIPLAVPPMIEAAFRYRGNRQYVSLGFGVHGGGMNDFHRDGPRPRTRGLLTGYLGHPAVKPYTDAFRINSDGPEWMADLSPEEVVRQFPRFEAWATDARCLLLDRMARQFYVGPVMKIRTWMILRSALGFAEPLRGPVERRRREIARIDERALWEWLDGQASAATPAGLTPAFIEEWERRYQRQQAVSACIGAGSKLGLKSDTIGELLSETFGAP